MSEISHHNTFYILRYKGYCFYMNTEIQGDFQICIIAPSMIKTRIKDKN